MASSKRIKNILDFIQLVANQVWVFLATKGCPRRLFVQNWRDYGWKNMAIWCETRLTGKDGCSKQVDVVLWLSGRTEWSWISLRSLFTKSHKNLYNSRSREGWIISTCLLVHPNR
jgi:hypothetical protein